MLVALGEIIDRFDLGVIDKEQNGNTQEVEGFWKTEKRTIGQIQVKEVRDEKAIL